MASPPIRPEDLARKYAGRYMICQDMATDGFCTWSAEPRGGGKTRGKISARSIEELAQMLAKAEA
jgi:hypothetical protein